MVKRLFYSLTFIATLTSCGIAMQDRIRSDVLANPNLDQKTKEAILNKAIHVGMTKQQVLASWGEPCWWCYGTRQTSNGDSWEYNVFGSSYMGAGSGTYLYFDNNGILQFWSK